MGGGQSDISNIGTIKGEGYRILHVRPNSPLDTLVDPFFDFIIDAVPLKQPERNPRDILNKLTETDGRPTQKQVKRLAQLFAQNENHPVSLKVVSTKYRNVRNIEITPNRNWNGHQDLVGIDIRLQRYDEAFETYFPVADVRPNSPIKKAGVREGEFLIGCKQFKYVSINELLENLYDRFFDKEVENKTVNLALYNISNDELKVTPVLLARGWGDKGILGCQFLEGHLNRFPKNLLAVREELQLRKKQSDENQRLKKELSESNGASVQLIQSLRAQKTRKNRTINQLKNLLVIEPFKPIKEQPKEQPQPARSATEINQTRDGPAQEYASMTRVRQLEDRVSTLQQMLNNVKNYIQNLGEEQEQAQAN